MKRLAGIEAEAVRIVPEATLQTRTDRFAFSIGRIDQGVTNYHPQQRIRYVAVELLAVNATNVAQTLDVKLIQLRSGGSTYTWQDRPSSVDGLSIQFGRHHLATREIQPPEVLAIPESSAVSIWLLFAGLDAGPFIPDLNLLIPDGDRTLSLDVRLFERAALRLSTERLGPADCLAVLRVHGELNSVSVGTLADELDRLGQLGIVRTVVVLTPDSEPIPQTLAEWLRQAHRPSPYSHSFRHLPTVPAMLSEFHVVIEQPESPQRGDQTVMFDEAVAASLRTAFASVDEQQVMQSLRSGNPSLRAAALRHGASRLQPQHWTIIERFLDAPETNVRLAAVSALGRFSSPEAVDHLRRLALSSDPDVAVEAVRALASSRHPSAHSTLANVLDSGLSVPQLRLVQILSLNPRPEWHDSILRFASHGESKVQQSAIQALARLGHDDLMAVLKRGLDSPDDRVREEAFRRLTDLGTRDSENLALKYVLDRLQTEPPSGAMHQFLERVRDQRVVPLLVRFLDGPEGVRRGVIELLAKIGDHTVAAELATRFPKLSDSEKAHTLQALQTLESDLATPLAVQSLRSDDVTLVQRAVATLQQDGSDEVVREMDQALRSLRGKSSTSAVAFLCNGLGVIGSPAARKVLVQLRRSTEEQARQHAQRGLQVLWNQSPARELTYMAAARIRNVSVVRQDASQAAALLRDPNRNPADLEQIIQEHLEQAAEQLSVAERLDPDYPDLQLQWGRLFALREDSEQAIARLRRAVELNEEFVDAHAELGRTFAKLERFEEAIPPLKFAFENETTNTRHEHLTSWALALIRLGRLEEAIALVQEHADTFPDQPIFDYNRACIYGRAVELLKSDPDLPVDDPRLAVFAEEAVRLLKLSFDHGLAELTGVPDMYEYMRSDPDLKPLHNVPAFREFAELDIPTEQRTRPDLPRDGESAQPPAQF